MTTYWVTQNIHTGRVTPNLDIYYGQNGCTGPAYVNAQDGAVPGWAVGNDRLGEEAYLVQEGDQGLTALSRRPAPDGSCESPIARPGAYQPVVLDTTLSAAAPLTLEPAP